MDGGVSILFSAGQDERFDDLDCGLEAAVLLEYLGLFGQLAGFLVGYFGWGRGPRAEEGVDESTLMVVKGWVLVFVGEYLGGEIEHCGGDGVLELADDAVTAAEGQSASFQMLTLLHWVILNDTAYYCQEIQHTQNGSNLIRSRGVEE